MISLNPAKQAHKFFDFKAGDQVLGGAVDDGPTLADDRPVDMEIRQHGEDRPPLRRNQSGGHFAPDGHLDRGGHDIPVGQDSPLGNAGRPAGELDQGRIFGQDGYPRHPGLGAVFNQLREMVPACRQAQFGRRALRHPLDIVRDPGHDHPRNRNRLGDQDDIGQNHIEGE